MIFVIIYYNTPIKTVEIWKDTYIRYFGYANEMGESLKFVFPTALGPSYNVAISYVLGDAIWTFKNSLKDKPYLTMTDELIWQIFASVIIPGITIHYIIKFFHHFLLKINRHSDFFHNWVPVVIGLSVIPFIIEPIDDLVTFTMNHTFRKLFNVKPRT